MTQAENQGRRSWLLAALYTASGITGVAYEVLWARMLSIQFGASTFGVVFTVTAFMAGLGIGSLLGNRVARRAARPALIFGLLEILVALYSLALPSISAWMSSAIESQARHLPLQLWIGFEGLNSILLLMLPALLMGMAFPVILKAFANAPVSLGKIYGLNTSGAAVGALLPLWLLPEYGWVWALRIVALCGIAIGIAAILAFRESRPDAGETSSTVKTPLGKLLPYAGIGAASLMLQVGWTRLYGLVMLRTEYVLALILAVYLVGMGVGSLFARREPNRRWLLILPAVAAGFTLLSLYLFPIFSRWVEAANFSSLAESMLKEGLALALMTLPVTLALGAWLPLLSAQLKTDGAGLYGVNSLGAAIGALVGGFLLIPSVGTAATVAIAALGLLAFGLYWVGDRRAYASIPLAAILAYPVLQLPEVSKLLPKEQAGSHDLYRSEDALLVTQVVEDSTGQRLLLTDLQRMDASTDPTAVAVQKNQARLPLLLHPDPHSILFLGLGTGISAAGSASFPKLRRAAVELSQGAIDASTTWFAQANQNIAAGMAISRNDARHFLAATTERYDVIVGDLFHPDLAGVGALLSVQQFQRARARLTDDGIFVQWVAINQFDTESLDTVLRSFGSVFPNAVLFVDGAHMALVGPRQRLAGAQAMLRNLGRLSPEQAQDATGGEGAWTWLGRYWGPIAATSGPVQEEWSPRIEFGLPRAKFAGAIDMPRLLAALLARRPAVKQAEVDLGIAPDDRERFERAYIGAELFARSWLALFHGDERKAQQLGRFAFEANPHDRWIASSLADAMMQSLPRAVAAGGDQMRMLQKILEVYPDDTEALRALWHLTEKSGNPDAARSYRERLQRLSPFDRELTGGAS